MTEAVTPSTRKPGEAFERLAAAVQARLEPGASRRIEQGLKPPDIAGD